MVARESDRFNIVLGASEREERGDEQKSIGSTHRSIFALFETASHAKRLLPERFIKRGYEIKEFPRLAVLDKEMT